MSNVGYAALVVIPTVRGIGQAIASQVTAPLNAAGTTSGRSFGSKLLGGVGTGLKVVAGTVAGIGAAVTALAAKGGISRALNIQDARASLSGLGHDTTAINGIMTSALDSVRGTAFGLDQAAKTAATAVAAGIPAGEALTRTLKLTADAATIANTPLGEMGSIFNKVATAGYLTRDVVNQLQDRGIPVLQLVAQQYGVTAEAASEMVSKGEVDFATFQNAIESGMGGAALKSGQTARGAFANIGAALSRLGAMFVQPGIDNAPSLFQSIAGAVDRAAVALQPVAAALAARVVPAFAALGGWIDRIDFGKVVNGLIEIYRGGVDVKDLLLTGFTENETLLPKPVVDGLRITHDVLAGIARGVREMFAAFQGGGDLSKVSTQFSSIGNSAKTLQPALESFITSLPNIGGAVATLAAAGLQVLVNVLSFLADHVDTIIAFMPLIVGGFLAWKGATALVFASQQNLALLQLRMMPLTTANTFARLAAARAELQLAAATGTSTAAQSGGLVATVRNTAATIGQKVAMVATRGAMIVATAAQWAWNAALSANPIGIIIVAIAALVAGLIWFFTQTELGRAVWENVMNAIGVAVTWLWESVISPVFNAIGAIFTWIYENIIYPIVVGIMIYIGLWAAVITWLWETVVSPIFNAIGALFSWVYENIIAPIVARIVLGIQVWGAIFAWLWESAVMPIVNAIGAAITWVYENVIMPIVAGIVAYVQVWGAIFKWLWDNAINPAIQAIGNAMNWVWNSVIMPVANFIGDAVRNIGGVFQSVFGGIAGFVGGAFQNIVGAIRGPINAVISLANSAIRAVNGVSVTIPDWVPVVGGQKFGISIPTIPMLAAGANIRPRSGGTMAILGEGGRAETVTDLGLTNRMMAATLSLVSDASPAADESVHFHGDVTTTDADELARKVQKKRRRARAKAGVDKKVSIP